MKKNWKIVLASGVFDVIHYGHIQYLEESKKAGGKNSKLIVVVARDATAEKLKGKRPVIPEDQRRAIVEALKPVDEAILGYDELNLEKVIMKIQPDIIAVGFDQKFIKNSVKNLIKKKGMKKIKIVEIKQFASEELNSSSKIKRRIMDELI